MNRVPPIHPRPYRMQNPIQPYAWGARDGEAFIPRLLGVAPQPGRPYAELWMGAHPKAPSAAIVEDEPVPLDRWIAAYPEEILGREVAARFGERLPFLFKVLSAAEALSIQAHPNKAQAEMLRARDPENYPDDNHKPELAVALDSLTALMGVKPPAEMAATLARYPELTALVGRAGERAFTMLIERSLSDGDAIAQATDALAARLSRTPAALREEERLFLALRAKYPPDDVGLLALFMLNLIHLAAGEGVFIAAGVPHAYIHGNIIECMANSDNVVRVGLTPKYKDARALLEVLDAATQPAVLRGGDADEIHPAAEVVYSTPAREFQVSRRRFSPGEERTEASDGRPAILLITQGEASLRWRGGAETFRRGESILIPAILDTFTVQAAGNLDLFTATLPVP